LIIGRMSGIESATVQFDEEIKRGLSQQKQKTAMVAVQTRGGQLDDDQVKAIRNVVASAYAGLDRRNITITDLNGATYGGASGPGAQANGVETPGNRGIAVSGPAGGPESDTTETRSNVQNVPGADTTLTQLAPLVPRKITASIALPASYYVEIWKKRNPQPAD